MDTQGDLSNWPFPIFNCKSKITCSQSELLSTNSLLKGPLVDLMFFPHIWRRKWGEMAKKKSPWMCNRAALDGSFDRTGKLCKLLEKSPQEFRTLNKTREKTCTQIDALLWIYDCWNHLLLKEWDEISLKLCIAESMAGVKDLTCLMLR